MGCLPSGLQVPHPSLHPTELGEVGVTSLGRGENQGPEAQELAEATEPWVVETGPGPHSMALSHLPTILCMITLCNDTGNAMRSQAHAQRRPVLLKSSTLPITAGQQEPASFPSHLPVLSWGWQETNPRPNGEHQPAPQQGLCTPSIPRPTPPFYREYCAVLQPRKRGGQRSAKGQEVSMSASAGHGVSVATTPPDPGQESRQRQREAWLGSSKTSLGPDHVLTRWARMVFCGGENPPHSLIFPTL